MANSIVLAQKYLPLLDEVYKQESKTADLESSAVIFDGAQTVKIFKMSLSGLKNYSRNSGFKQGDVNGSWESWTLENDRGISFQVDVMDNEETLDLAFGRLAGTFVRTKEVPEVDMYRFAKLASSTGVSKETGALTKENILEAIVTAEGELSENEVPEEGRILYITPTAFNVLKQVAGTRVVPANGSSVNYNFPTFDGMKIVQVPQSRFVTATQYNSATEEIEKTSTAKNINFMIVHPSAVEATTKRAKLRVFDPDTNQQADAYKFDYRLYHGLFVYENKAAGIYVHTAA